MRRVVIPELLDSDAGTPAEIAASLADLGRINRWFGGIRTMTALLRKVARVRGLKTLTLLDVAGASGDVALAAQAELAAEGIEIRPLLLDRAASHLTGKAASIVGDAMQLPLVDASVDVVACSLFTHHLEPEQVTRFAQEALRVARHALVISDLMRSPVHLALGYAGLPLFSRLTRHDTIASIRRSYTVPEMRNMLATVEAANIEIAPHFLFRMGVVLLK